MPPSDISTPRQLTLQDDAVVVPLHVEEISVAKRRVKKAVVKVATVTRNRNQLVEEQLTHERVDVTRVPVDRYVESVPPVRVEDGVTIMSVVEEVVVVERRLLLREEVHVRSVRTAENFVETVELREQDAVITRTPADEQAMPAISTANPSTLETENG
jgi:stress response protein YsnF